MDYLLCFFFVILKQECQDVDKGGNYFEFFHNSRLVKPTILHFQVCAIVPYLLTDMVQLIMPGSQSS